MAQRRITEKELNDLKSHLRPLAGYQFDILRIPNAALANFEPSQVGTIVGTLIDASLPFLPGIPQVGIAKHEGLLGDREGYPDYHHASGKRLELKLLYVDNPDLEMKRPPTVREASARLTQKVTIKNVQPDRDAMLLIAYQLRPIADDKDRCSPTIIDFELFSMIELIEARDARMALTGGRWFGNFETPTILSRIGKAKLTGGLPPDINAYGRKESEGRDYNEDTNFGKLKRIPYAPLQNFLRKHRQASGPAVLEGVTAGDIAADETGVEAANLEQIEQEL